jgi:hypothetical protein
LAAHGLQADDLAAAHGLQALVGVHGAHGFFAAQGLLAAAAFTRGTKQFVLALLAAPAAQGLQGLQAAFAAQGLQGLQGFLAAQGLHGAFAAQGLFWATMVCWLEVWLAAKAAALTATPTASGTTAAVDSSLIRNSLMVCLLPARNTSPPGRSRFSGSTLAFGPALRWSLRFNSSSLRRDMWAGCPSIRASVFYRVVSFTGPLSVWMVAPG